MKKSRISGKDAAYVAMEAAERHPVKLSSTGETHELANVSQPVADQPDRPPRVRKPSPHHDQCIAPIADLEQHRRSLREAFGNTLSDEFVEVIMGKLIEALRPNSSDVLEEATLNAALAMISSMKPASEFEAFLAVQIIGTGFSGLRFLRQSHRHMTEDYIDVYGNYALKLLRVQNELIQTFERCRRRGQQTVEVRHVHIHSGGQGVVGIVNADKREGGEDK